MAPGSSGMTQRLRHHSHGLGVAVHTTGDLERSPVDHSRLERAPPLSVVLLRRNNLDPEKYVGLTSPDYS